MQMRKTHHNARRMYVQQMTPLKFNSDGTQNVLAGLLQHHCRFTYLI